MTRQGVSMRVVVTGAAGRLGAVMARELAAAGHQVTALTRAELDIRHAQPVQLVMRMMRPDVIVNCSAYNAVDAAERDPAAALAVNAHGPAALAAAACDIGARLVHYSTDFVFDGRASEPYSEDAPASPLSVYGASKLEGEQEVRRLPEHYILRVASLFGGASHTSQRSTIDYFAESLVDGTAVRAATDRTVSPSHVDDVVRVTRGLIEEHAPYGTYHCVASGATTWYEVAHEIARQLGVHGPVYAITANDVPGAAPRPRFCALSNQKLIDLGVDMPTWKVAIARHLASRSDLRRRPAPRNRAG